VCGFAVLMQDW